MSRPDPKWMPVTLTVLNRLCLVIGGGQVAVRKVQTLLQAGARVLVVSPALSPGLLKLAEKQKIEWKARAWKKCDLDRAWLVIAATSDPKVNHRIKKEAERRRLWVNAVDDPKNCSAVFPSVLTRSGIQIAVSTSGQSPALARKIRESLERDWDPKAGQCLAWISAFRAQVKKKISDPKQRFAFWDQALSPPTLQLIRQGKTREVKRSLQSSFRKFRGKQ